MFFPVPYHLPECHQSHSDEASGANGHPFPDSLSNSPAPVYLPKENPLDESNHELNAEILPRRRSCLDLQTTETNYKLGISEPEKNHLLAQPPVPANFDESAWFPHQKSTLGQKN